MIRSMTSYIFNMFARSPIRPLQKHIDKAFAAAAGLVPFIEAVLVEDWAQAEIAQRHIEMLEKEADILKRDLRLHLPKGLFLPVSRGDLLQLIVEQDRLANLSQDIAGLIFGRRMKIPNPIAEDYVAFLHRCIEAAEQAKKAINELDELLETGFRGNEMVILEQMVVKLNKLEHDTDHMQIQIRQKLFAMEAQLNPIDTIFLYKIIEKTGVLADCAQTIGSRLQLLVA